MSRFLAAYRTYVEKMTDAPIEFIEAGGIACLSTIAMGRRWLARGDEIRPNLFMMLVAGSSRDRKSFCVRAAMRMIGDVEGERIGPEDFTAEALAKVMAVPKNANMPHRNILTVGIEEFGVYLVQSRSYNATGNSTLCKLYDGHSFEKVRVTSAPIVVERPRLTIFAACAFGMFERYADSKDWNTGFYARFLFVPGMTKRPRQAIQPPDAPMEADLARAHLVDLRRELEEHKGPMAVLPEAEYVFKLFQESFGAESLDPAEQAYRERLTNSTWKLALLYQIDLNPTHPIGADAMNKAVLFARTAYQGFMQAYRTTAGDDFSRTLRKVWQAISSAGPDGIMRSKLLRRFHLDAVRLKAVLEALAANGAIEAKDEDVENGRGRSSRRQVVTARIPYSDD